MTTNYRDFWVDANVTDKAVSQPNTNKLYLTDKPKSLQTQVGGDHYKDKGIQPIHYIHANNLGFCEGNIVKYVTRWRDKNGLEDLLKIKHYVDLLIELEKLQEK